MNTYSYKKPLSFNEITIEQINKNVSEGVYLRGEAQEHWIKQEPKFVDDPDECNIFHDLQKQTCSYPQQFILSVRDVKLVGVRTFLDRHENWFNDQSYTLGEFDHDLKKIANYQDLFFNECTGFRPTEKSAVFNFEHNNRVVAELGGKTLIGCCFEAGNYGSWIFRVIPKIYSAIKMGLNYDRILIEYKQHKRLQEYFDLMGVDRSRLMHHDKNVIYKLENALVPSLLCSSAYLNKETQEFYKMMRSQYGFPCMGERIYVSRLSFAREGKTTRILENETELIEALSKEGFKIVYPELLSARAQIETFSAAKVVVGPAGSGMFNVAFCHPGTKLIDVESEPYWVHHHISLFSSLSLDFGIFVGKVDPSDPNWVHKRWTVNIPALISRIRSFCNA